MHDLRNVIATLRDGPALEWIGAISGCVLLAGFVWSACLVFSG